MQPLKQLLSTQEVVHFIATMQTPAQVAHAQKQTTTRLHITAIRNALFDRLTEFLQPVEVTAAVTPGNSLQLAGTTYDLSEWLTLSAYVDRYGLRSTNVLSNWISRGTVPADCVLEVHPLNGLKLIRDQPYASPQTGTT